MSDNFLGGAVFGVLICGIPSALVTVLGSDVTKQEVFEYQDKRYQCHEVARKDWLETSGVKAGEIKADNFCLACELERYNEENFYSKSYKHTCERSKSRFNEQAV